MFDWIADNRGILWVVAAVSAVIFVASLVIIPAIVVRIRPDYFSHAERPASRWAHHGRSTRIAIMIGKNLLGAILMIAGVAMLVLPGQGLLTMLVGFFLIDFPGKYRLEKWLVSQRWVLGPINWLRTRRNQQPLQVTS